ncbi:MAG TPA: recombination protein RecR [bacterium]|nr:recombination protein RecR [bacterium]
MYPESIQKLIDKFSKFPTIGPRTAARFVFYLLHLSEKEIEELIDSISNLKKNITICSFCFNSFEQSFDSPIAKKTWEIKKTMEDNSELCNICEDIKRDKTRICVVAKESDLISIEKTNKYSGLYFILGGTILTLQKKEIEKIRLNELKERILDPKKFGLSNSKIKEVILALNPTTEGEATASYIERKLKPLEIKITKLARGLPVGGELEYADEETLGSALEGRK